MEGVLSHDAVVRDPDRCCNVLRDKGYDIELRLRGGEARYILVGEPEPYTPTISTFPGDPPEVDDRQEKLF
jgi:hypothetical protein